MDLGGVVGNGGGRVEREHEGPAGEHVGVRREVGEVWRDGAQEFGGLRRGERDDEVVEGALRGVVIERERVVAG